MNMYVADRGAIFEDEVAASWRKAPIEQGNPPLSLLPAFRQKRLPVPHARSRVGLEGFAENSQSDLLLEYLVGALVDLRDPGVQEVSGGSVFERVAVGAEDLDRPVRRVEGCVSPEVLRLRYLQVGGVPRLPVLGVLLVLLLQVGGPQDQPPRRLHVRRDYPDVPLDELVLPNRLTVL